MSTVVLIAVGTAALACPLHMLWHMRRHGTERSGGCGRHAEPPVEELRARHEAVARELARREAPERHEALL